MQTTLIDPSDLFRVVYVFDILAAVVFAVSGALVASGVSADVVVGSTRDPREASTLADYAVPPRALVMTQGAAGGYVETAAGTTQWSASPAPDPIVGSYGSGDTFAAALTWYLARGHDLVEACKRAAKHGAAVLRGINPLDWQLELE